MPRRKTPTFVSSLEQVADNVSTWGKEYIENVVSTLSPDGRPFGAEKKAPRHEVDEYLTIRGNPEAWKGWINEKVGEITALLSAVPKHEIAAIRPYEVALRYGWSYSARMEQLIPRFYPELANPALLPQPEEDLMVVEEEAEYA